VQLYIEERYVFVILLLWSGLVGFSRVSMLRVRLWLVWSMLNSVLVVEQDNTFFFTVKTAFSRCEVTSSTGCFSSWQ